MPNPSIVAAIFGLEFGSFANVCIYRWPRALSINYPRRSFCPWCHEKISWFDNIPILSFLFLLGRCRSCHCPISWRYPLVELLMSVVWGLMTLPALDKQLLPFQVAIYLFVFVAISTTWIDYDWKIIPDEATWPLAIVGLLAAPFNPMLTIYGQGTVAHLMQSLLGCLMGGGIIFLISIVGKFIFSREAIGWGDIKLLACYGTILGVSGVLNTLFLSVIFAGVFGVVGLLSGFLKRRQYVPFGPFINAGALLVLLNFRLGWFPLDSFVLSSIK